MYLHKKKTRSSIWNQDFPRKCGMNKALNSLHSIGRTANFYSIIKLLECILFSLGLIQQNQKQKMYLKVNFYYLSNITRLYKNSLSEPKYT